MIDIDAKLIFDYNLLMIDCIELFDEQLHGIMISWNDLNFLKISYF